MKLPYIAGALLVVTSSCVTPNDLRDLADNVELYQQGAITEPELHDAIEQKAEEIEKRTEELVESMPTTPAGWAALLAQLAATESTDTATSSALPEAKRSAARLRAPKAQKVPDSTSSRRRPSRGRALLLEGRPSTPLRVPTRGRGCA